MGTPAAVRMAPQHRSVAWPRAAWSTPKPTMA